MLERQSYRKTHSYEGNTVIRRKDSHTNEKSYMIERKLSEEKPLYKGNLVLRRKDSLTEEKTTLRRKERQYYEGKHVL